MDERLTSAPLRASALLALLVVLAALASGCGSSATPAAAAADTSSPHHGGQITVGIDQQPQCLNTTLICGGMATTNIITSPVWDSLLMIDGNGQWKPLIAMQVPTTDNGLVVKRPGGAMDVTMRMHPEAIWSDGQPITCADVRFTWQTVMDDRWTVTSRDGWDLVDSVDCPDPHTVVYHFSKRYAPFLNLVGAATVLPEHDLRGKDFNTYLNDKLPVTSGPFRFDHWTRSVEIVLQRNPHYWNAGRDQQPWLDTLRYVFIPDGNTLKIQLRTGEVDVINPPPDTSLREELAAMPRAAFQIEPGVYWEQIAFNNGRPPTNDVNVRKAIAASIDRSQITDVVLKKQVGVLNSTILPALKDYYVPEWSDVQVNAKTAQGYLEKSGYKRNGEYYEKAGQPLTVVFKSTAGNVLRLKVAQLLQQELKANGIKMEIALEPPEVFFGQTVVQGAFDLALWSWSSKSDPSQKTLFTCDNIPTKANKYSGQNYYRYCNEEVSKLLENADVEPDIARRAAMTKRVQQLMHDDMPVLPMFQRPETIAYSHRARGLENNPLSGMTWNTQSWSAVAAR